MTRATGASELRELMHVSADTRGIREMARLETATALSESVGSFARADVGSPDGQPQIPPGISHVQCLALAGGRVLRLAVRSS
jgi:hypothetical protein